MIERTDAVEEHGEAFNEAHDEAPTDAALLAEARRLILKHLPSPGVRLTDVPGLALYHVASNDFIERNAGELLVSFIVSGRKATAVGDRVLEYGPGQSLVCGIASPTEFHTLDASPESPFLALAVSLDTAILMEYAAAIGLKASDSNPDDDSGGVFVIRPDVDLARAFLRLLRLLERPALVAVRAPGTEGPSRPVARLERGRHAARPRDRGLRRARRVGRRRMAAAQLRRQLLGGGPRRALAHVAPDLPQAFPKTYGPFARAIPKTRATLRSAKASPFAPHERCGGIVRGRVRELVAVRARL